MINDDHNVGDFQKVSSWKKNRSFCLCFFQTYSPPKKVQVQGRHAKGDGSPKSIR